MPNPSQVEIEEFLMSIANLLGTSVSIPDYSQLFDSEDPTTFWQVGMASPDDIEVALVMGLQRAEIALKEAAEEKRVAEQWSIVESVVLRKDTVPHSPTSSELEIVSKDNLPDLETLLNEAEKAFLELSNARGEPDDVFELATEKSLKALDERDNGVAKQHEAVKTELERRKKVLAEIKEKFAIAEKDILPKAKDILASDSKATTVKQLRAARLNCNQAIGELELSVDKHPPNVFDELVVKSDSSIQGVKVKTPKVNDLAISAISKDRSEQFGKLDKTAPKVFPNDLLILPTGELKVRYESSVKTWQEKYTTLSNRSKEFATIPEFDQSLTEIDSLYDLAEDAAIAVRQASEIERKRRMQVAEELKLLRKGVKAPETLPMQGTEEQIAYALCDRKYSDATQKLNESITKGTPDEFTKAEQSVRDAIRNLENEGPIASNKALERNKVTKELKDEITNRVSPCYKSIATELANCPIKDVIKSVQGAFQTQTKSRTSQIKGIDPANDKKLQKELNTLAKDTESLIDKLKNLESIRFVEVANNIAITTEISKLNSELTQPGIGSAVIATAENIREEAKKILERYDRIESLRLRFNEATSDKNIVPTAQKTLQGFPEFDKVKDSMNKGDLSDQYNIFLKAIQEIEDKKAERALQAQTEQQRNLYLASESYKFKQLMENPGSGANYPTTKLETLVTENKAAMGPITDAYQSSYDKPNKFSVEVDVLIETYKDVVVHAHCATDGTPLPGNACHIKLWRYRFEPGGYQLTPTLRNQLLPNKTSCFQKAQNKGLA